MKFIKKHKSLVAALIVFILVLAAFLFLYRKFFPDEETAIYGSRLDGMKGIEIKEKELKCMEEKEKSISKSVSAKVQGRLVNVHVTVNGNVTRDSAKETTKELVGCLSKKQSEYFDVQVFVKKEDASEDAGQFPIIGYRHHTAEGFTWTKDR